MTERQKEQFKKYSFSFTWKLQPHSDCYSDLSFCNFLCSRLGERVLFSSYSGLNLRSKEKFFYWFLLFHIFPLKVHFRNIKTFHYLLWMSISSTFGFKGKSFSFFLVLPSNYQKEKFLTMRLGFCVNLFTSVKMRRWKLEKYKMFWNELWG